MGIFGEERASDEMEAKDRQIADLQAQLAKSQKAKAATSKVAAKDIIDDEEGGDLNTVSVRLPTFTESNPELWFGKAEAQFALRGVKDDTTKFYHLYSNLTEKAMNEIENLLLDPPATGKVAAMKHKLVRKFGRSQFQKDSELLGIRSLGDLKPTEMWSKFQRLNKDPSNATSSFVRAYLINMYPPEVRSAIANMSFADNDEMAEAADKIIDMKKPGQVNSVAQAEDGHEEETAEVDAISRGGSARGRGSSRGRFPAGGQRPTPGPARQSKTCFYHDKYGLGAFRCEGSPCPFANAPLANKSSGNATAGR